MIHHNPSSTTPTNFLMRERLCAATIGRGTIISIGLCNVALWGSLQHPACEEPKRNSWSWWWSPFPRALVKNDPIWRLTARQVRQRTRDEKKQQALLQEIQTVAQNAPPPSNASTVDVETFSKQLAQLQQQWLDVVYGRGVSLQERRDFLERYGCTGYTDEVLDVILDICGEAHPNGLVEMGAGNGQWARALSDRYKNTGNHRQAPFVLAFDNSSQLPLNPSVYHSKTQPVHQYFYPHVQPLLSNNSSIDHTLQQWSCRGRALLLVYPSPMNPMATRAIHAYSALPQHVHTLFYVGEGPGGANADEDFFDCLETAGWILLRVVPVKSFGTKGYEKLYILRKEKQDEEDKLLQ